MSKRKRKMMTKAEVIEWLRQRAQRRVIVKIVEMDGGSFFIAHPDLRQYTPEEEDKRRTEGP